MAADLDNAVAEWGRFVEGKMDEAMHAYWDSVSDRNARRDAKSKSEPVKVDREETKNVRDEAWWYWVKQRIRRVVGVAGADRSGALRHAGKMVIIKPITGDPLIDGENDHPNAREIYVPD